MLVNDDLTGLEDALLQKSVRLTFTPKLECAYDAQRTPERIRAIQQYLVLSILFHLVFLACDVHARVVPILRWAVPCRLGICIGVTLLALWLLSRRLPAWLVGLVAVAPMLVCTAAIGSLARLVGSPQGDLIMVGPALCIFTQTLIAPVPFRYAMRGLLASILLYVCFSLVPVHGHAALSGEGSTFVCVVGLCALWERYRREKSERKHFLLGELNRLHMEDILRLNTHLERLSSMDGLTGVFNRRYLDAALARLWMVAADHERWIGVIMVDIDHFKALNDTAGHQHGDYCLQQVATILQKSVRAGVDTVARYGGEEFVAILPEADESEVSTIAERIRTAIEAVGLPAAPDSVVTVSAGAAAVRGGNSKVTLEGFIAAADQALYQAKRSGRNRTVCFDQKLLQDV